MDEILLGDGFVSRDSLRYQFKSTPTACRRFADKSAAWVFLVNDYISVER